MPNLTLQQTVLDRSHAGPETPVSEEVCVYSAVGVQSLRWLSVTPSPNSGNGRERAGHCVGSRCGVLPQAQPTCMQPATRPSLRCPQGHGQGNGADPEAPSLLLQPALLE